jgi:dynein light intermediate chain 1, cytosolic
LLLLDGASLIYTTPSVSNSLQGLIHSSLGIQSLLKKQPLKHNVIDRDRVLVPPNWDSWGKIRVLREGFDVEGVNDSWTNDVYGISQSSQVSDGSNSTETANGKKESAVSVYEETIRDPRKDTMLEPGSVLRQRTKALEVESQETQKFFADQLEVVDKMRADEEKKGSGRDSRPGASGRHVRHTSTDESRGSELADDGGRVNEHIGPVQVNMGGIQMDADDMLKRLNVSISLLK